MWLYLILVFSYLYSVKIQLHKITMHKQPETVIENNNKKTNLKIYLRNELVNQFFESINC